jgi:hypothetical protein
MPVQHQKQQKQEIPTCINHAQDGNGIKGEGENKQIKLGAAAFAALPASHPVGDGASTVLPDPEVIDPWN